jgi:acetoacetyl-CoA reductase
MNSAQSASPASQAAGMQNTTALVTGGTGTIGSAICRALAANGAQLVAIHHPGESQQAAEWQQQMAANGFKARIESCDVADFDAVSALVQRLEADGVVTDILVNAAGITRDAPLKRMQVDQWQAVMRVNLDSVFNTCRNVIEGMLARGYGRIVNISSVNGQKGQFGQTNYSAAKAGMHGFTMALAREAASEGVTVNTLSPGYIDSPMIRAVPEPVRDRIEQDIPVKRFGTPEDIARAVVFLTAEQAGFITGSDLSVNGGQHMG